MERPRDEEVRRALDVLASAAGVVLLSPLFVILALLIRHDSPGPVLHRAIRVGRDGRLFTLYKFRSMVVGSAQSGSAITARGDPRVTSVGRVLRRSKLDELPQLWNVIKGDMSLVGPRPEDPRYTALYSPEQRTVLRVRPGVTSPASLRYRSEEQLLAGTEWEDTYVHRVMPAKLAIDLDYLRRRTVWSDVVVVFATDLPARSPAASNVTPSATVSSALRACSSPAPSFPKRPECALCVRILPTVSLLRRWLQCRHDLGNRQPRTLAWPTCWLPCGRRRRLYDVARSTCIAGQRSSGQRPSVPALLCSDARSCLPCIRAPFPSLRGAGPVVSAAFSARRML